MRPLQWILLATLSVAALTFLQAGNAQFPAYVSWDMDLITMVDLFRLRSQEIPLHINHPGLGMYLILYPFFLFADLIQVVSAADYRALSQFANPLIPVVQTVDWVRSLNVFIALAMSLSTFLGVRKIVGSGWTGFCAGVGAFIAVVCSTSIWQFHLVTNRTEFYSLFFLSLAFYFASVFMVEKSRNCFWWLILFLALAFLTKIQALFVILFFIVFADNIFVNTAHEIRRKEKLLIQVASGFFALLTLLSLLIQIPDYFAAFANSYAVNVFFILFVVGFSIHFVNQKYGAFVNSFARAPLNALRILKTGPKIFLNSEQTSHWFFPLSAFVAVVMVLLLTHFLLMPQASGVLYLLYTFKVLFLRISDYNTVSKDLNYYIENIQWNFNYHILSIVAVVILFLCLSWSARKKQSHWWLRLLVCFALLGFNLILGNRRGAQDALWNELFLIWFIPLMAWFVLSVKQLRHIFLLVYFLSMAAWRVHALPSGAPYVSEHQSHWYMDSLRFLTTVYYAPNDAYVNLIYQPTKYKSLSERRALLLQASQHKEIKNLGERLWITPRFDMAHVSLVSEIWKSEALSGWTVLGKSETQAVQLYFEDNRNYFVVLSDVSVFSEDPACLNVGNTKTLVDAQGFVWTAIPVRSDYKGVCGLKMKRNQLLYVVTANMIGAAQ